MTAGREDGRELSILIVEDEPVNRALLRAVLNSSSALGPKELAEAADLGEARRQLAERLPDVLILDVRLPDGNGLELLGALPAQGDPARPFVLVMSASVLPADRDAALSSGSDAFMGKPFMPKDLIDLLRERVLGVGRPG